MPRDVRAHNELLPHLFRQEYSKMTAVLCRHFGLDFIETAEDIASDTFLKASEYWAINGMPDKPTAWLYAVAKNKANDYFKHLATFDNKVKVNIEKENLSYQEPDFSQETISDSQLAMIFNVCNPLNSQEAQICLALQILCGFSVEEIASAFIANRETIKKRLQRARAILRRDNFQIKTLDEATLKSRQDVVLKTLYLLFNEGYYSKSNSEVIRKDLCWEAMRLTLILTTYTATNTPKANALMALMCFQSSRLDARTNQMGEIILFESQNRSLWDKELIEKGNYFLVNACSGNQISKYHLEAGIAYWHTTPKDDNKWKHILQLYDQLLQIEYSPIVALNRIFAFAQMYGEASAVKEVKKLELNESCYFHSLLGYLSRKNNTDQAILHYKKAVALTASKVERKVLLREIEKLKKKV